MKEVSSVEMRKYDAVLFDFDGTLVNTLEDLTNSVNYTLKSYGFESKSAEEIRSYLGDGADTLIKRALPQGIDDATTAKALDTYMTHYLEHCMDNIAIYPDIEETIKKLRYEGILVGIASNKPEVSLKKLCNKYFSADFDCIIGQSRGIAKKPEPDMVNKIMRYFSIKPEKIVYVGDSEHDVLTAKNCGIDFIGVEWGYRGREALEKCGADTIIKTPLELITLVTHRKDKFFSINHRPNYKEA